MNLNGFFFPAGLENGRKMSFSLHDSTSGTSATQSRPSAGLANNSSKQPAARVEAGPSPNLIIQMVFDRKIYRNQEMIGFLDTNHYQGEMSCVSETSACINGKLKRAPKNQEFQRTTSQAHETVCDIHDCHVPSAKTQP